MELFTALAHALRFPAFIAFGPFVALVVQRRLRKVGPSARRRVVFAALLSVMIELVTTLTAWSFRDFWPQEINLEVAYVAVCVLIMLASESAPKRRTSTLKVSAILLLPLLLYSFWVDFWRSDPIDSQVFLSRRVVVDRHAGGMSFAGWEGVKIAERPRYLPFLEKILFSVRIGETEDCNENTINVTLNPATHTVTVSCGLNEQYIWERVQLQE